MGGETNTLYLWDLHTVSVGGRRGRRERREGGRRGEEGEKEGREQRGGGREGREGAEEKGKKAGGGEGRKGEEKEDGGKERGKEDCLLVYKVIFIRQLSPVLSSPLPYSLLPRSRLSYPPTPQRATLLLSALMERFVM